MHPLKLKHHTRSTNLASADSMAMTRWSLSVPELHGVVSVGVVVAVALGVGSALLPARGSRLLSKTPL